MKFSIITINLNGNRFLSTAIKSVREQVYDNFELIIVDGGSTDGSLETVESLSAIDNRIRWVSERDNGISSAMNKGIGMATGDVISFLHSDDSYSSEYVLEWVYREFQGNPESVWLTGGLALMNQSDMVFRDLGPRNYSFRRLIRSNILFHPSTFVRTAAFDVVGYFDESLRFAMDYELWLRLAVLGDPLLLKKTLACFRVHDGSLSMAAAQKALEEEGQIRKRFLLSTGRRVWPYTMHGKIKSIVNFFFIKNLKKAARTH